MEKETKIINWEHVYFVHHKILSPVTRVECVSDRMSYTVLRGRSSNITVLNVHAPSGDSKDSFYEELHWVLDHFPTYYMKILLADFNAKSGRKDIFRPTIGNNSLHQESNNNCIRIVNLAT